MDTQRWIVNPVVDLLFVCGGLVWILVFLTNSSGDFALAGNIAVAAHLFSETHIAATLRKIYNDPSSIARHSMYTIILPLFSLAIFVVGISIPGITAALLKAYLIMLMYHFMSQTYGIALLYLYKWNYAPGVFFKSILRGFLLSIASMNIAKQLAEPSALPESFLGLQLPASSLLPHFFVDITQQCFYTIAFVLVCSIVFEVIESRKYVPLPVVLILLTSVAAFGTNSVLQGLFWFYLPAFFHGSQYIAITLSQHLKSRNHDIRHINVEMSNETLGYYLSLLLIAVAIYIALPQALRFAGVQYDLAFATVFALVGLHHFMTDQAIWKLRDPKVRNPLL